MEESGGAHDNATDAELLSTEAPRDTSGTMSKVSAMCGGLWLVAWFLFVRLGARFVSRWLGCVWLCFVWLVGWLVVVVFAFGIFGKFMILLFFVSWSVWKFYVYSYLIALPRSGWEIRFLFLHGIFLFTYLSFFFFFPIEARYVGVDFEKQV